MIALILGMLVIILMMASFPERAERILVGGGLAVAIMHVFNMRNSNII